MCKMMISPAWFFFHFFKILIFRVFQTSSVNAKRKFWGVSHLYHMRVISFPVSLSNPFRNFICNIMLIANWQDSYIHTYQILFQMFHFPIARDQFPTMSSKLVDMCRFREVDSRFQPLKFMSKFVLKIKQLCFIFSTPMI